MSINRITARVPSAVVDTVASLKNHVLKFHKKSNNDGSAKCDVIETPNHNDIVWGVVFDIKDSEKADLDRYEGLGYGYEVKLVELTGLDGKTFQAFTYYATEIDERLKPYSWYTMHVLRGAKENNLPAEYIVSVEKIEAMQDPDRERHDRELSIYR